MEAWWCAPTVAEMTEGRLNTFFKEECLLEQEFVLSEKKGESGTCWPVNPNIVVLGDILAQRNFFCVQGFHTCWCCCFSCVLVLDPIVAQHLKELAKTLGGDIVVREFLKLERGEGIEKNKVCAGRFVYGLGLCVECRREE